MEILQFILNGNLVAASGRWNQPYDRVNIVHNKLSAVDYSKYKSIQFIINIEIWEEDDGYQYLMLYDQYNSNTGIEIWGTEINHKPSGKSSEHHTYQFIFNIPWNASKIQNNVYQDTFYLLYGASGAWDDDWRNSNCYVSCFLSVDEPNATTNGSVSWG